jgi:hypothetical protein
MNLDTSRLTGLSCHKVGLAPGELTIWGRFDSNGFSASRELPGTTQRPEVIYRRLADIVRELEEDGYQVDVFQAAQAMCRGDGQRGEFGSVNSDEGGTT